jgi:hypothetical protein
MSFCSCRFRYVNLFISPGKFNDNWHLCGNMNKEHEMSFDSIRNKLPVGFDNSGESAGNLLLV